MFLINPFTFAAAGGNFEPIATVTVGSSGASSIEFTSIPGTYQHLQVRWIGRGSGSGGYPGSSSLSFNSDTTVTNYRQHWLLGNGSSVGAGNNYQKAQMLSMPGAAISSNIFSAGVFNILDYADTSKNTTCISFEGADTNGAGTVFLVSYLWMNTAAVSSISIVPDVTYISPFAQHTQFALYGIKA